MSGGPVSGRLLRVTAREARRVRRGRLKPEAAGVAGDVPWPGPGRECGGPRRDLHHHLIPDLQDQLHPGVTDGKYDCGRSAVSQPAGTSQKEEGHCRGGDSGFKGSCAGHSRSAPSPGPMAGALRAALFLGVLAQLPPDFLWASPVGEWRDRTYRDASDPFSVPIFPLRVLSHRSVSPQQVLHPAPREGAAGPRIPGSGKETEKYG
ncbi:Hypothetical predicted protein [Marmota monax]|uniref:Uncharacterized protein n=1 Tax=Marmota monax TaxID=9995 RepID=A0A5E4D666_MARMO|nr:Hypothetical predicted protein [Marmota monax]